MTLKWAFDIQDTDVYWCTADVGWITGHSYIVYGPLSNGATSLMYEGAPRPSNPGCFWDVVEKYGVNIFLHGAHGGSGLHQDGRTFAQGAEFVLSTDSGDGGRTD